MKRPQFVKELETFLTLTVLKDTSAVYRLESFAMKNGYSYEWINGQKPHLIEDGIRIQWQHGELRSDRGSRLVNEFFLQFSLFNIHDTFKAGNRSSHVFLKLVYLTNHDCEGDSGIRARRDLCGIVQYLCQVNLLNEKNGVTRFPSQPKSKTKREIRDTEDQNGIVSLPVLVSSSNVEEMIERGNPLFAAERGMRTQANPNPTTNKEETKIERGNPLFADSGRAPLSSEIPNGCKNSEKSCG